MKVAIYAGPLPGKQPNVSIEEQILACKKHIEENHLLLEERHIYSETENSDGPLGSASQRLQKAIRYNEISAVVILDIMALSSGNLRMLELVNKFHYYSKIAIITVKKKTAFSSGLGKVDQRWTSSHCR